MLVFPNCKINLGLHVTEKRPDGFHNIETVFYPVSWCDALEVIENKEDLNNFVLTQSGLAIEGNTHDNLLYKSWALVVQQRQLPPIKVHLHKNIPMGAGLGGGSADAAFFINLLDKKFELGFSHEEKCAIASQLGSDCAFFIENRPVLASGRGNEFSKVNLNLANYHLLVVYPEIHSNTREAYSGLSPKPPVINLRSIIEDKPLAEWKHVLVNDFEVTLFAKYPLIKALKENLYAAGALYAAMSGSGSAVFGIFDKEPQVSLPENYKHCLQKPVSKFL